MTSTYFAHRADGLAEHAQYLLETATAGDQNRRTRAEEFLEVSRRMRTCVPGVPVRLAHGEVTGKLVEPSLPHDALASSTKVIVAWDDALRRWEDLEDLIIDRRHLVSADCWCGPNRDAEDRGFTHITDDGSPAEFEPAIIPGADEIDADGFSREDHR